MDCEEKLAKLHQQLRKAKRALRSVRSSINGSLPISFEELVGENTAELVEEVLEDSE